MKALGSSFMMPPKYLDSLVKVLLLPTPLGNVVAGTGWLKP